MAGRLLLYSLPPLVIVAGALRGCRPAERTIAFAVAAAAAAVLVPSLVLLDLSGSELAAGSAYASLVIFSGITAMLVRPRRGGEPPRGGGAEEPPQGPPPFDWDDFERRFWEDVRRRASSGPGRPAPGRPPARAPSGRCGP